MYCSCWGDRCGAVSPRSSRKCFADYKKNLDFPSAWRWRDDDDDWMFYSWVNLSFNFTQTHTHTSDCRESQQLVEEVGSPLWHLFPSLLLPSTSLSLSLSLPSLLLLLLRLPLSSLPASSPPLRRWKLQLTSVATGRCASRRTSHNLPAADLTFTRYIFSDSLQLTSF